MRDAAEIIFEEKEIKGKVSPLVGGTASGKWDKHEIIWVKGEERAKEKGGEVKKKDSLMSCPQQPRQKS